MSTPPISYAEALLPEIGASAPRRRWADGAARAEALVAAHNFCFEAPRRFFDGASDRAAWTALRSRLPEDSDAVVASANLLLAGVPINRENDSPDPALTAPSQRHQSAVRLAQAYALTGEERYADGCIAAIESWIGHSPNERAAVVGTPEDGLRLISWCWALVLVRESPVLDALRLAAVANVIHEHATSLSAEPRWSGPATNVIANALGLFYAAALFPEFVESREWRDASLRVLVAECERQVHADGVHFEQSTCFQRYAIDAYLHLLLLAARHRIDVPPLVAQRLQRMLEFVLAIRMPDGTVPSIGDSDGGCLLPLAPRSTADARGRFAVAAALFGRSDFAWAADGLAPEVGWLMGTGGIRAFDALLPAPPAAAPSRAFPSGGYAVMRSGWNRDAHQMLVDVGPLGCPVSGAHGHADLLSIQCSIFGDPVIVDPGTHCYGDSRWRDFFRSTAAHSTVVVDGVSQAEASGSFGWRRQPRVRLREWHSTPDVDFLDAEHDGYASLPQPVVHRRRVIFIKSLDAAQSIKSLDAAQSGPVDKAQGGPACWIVVDDLSGSGRHDVDLRFQFGGGNVALGPHPWARAAAVRGQCLWISPFPSAPAQPAVKCGAPSPICGWIAPEFTRLSPAPMLIYSFAVALPWRIVTLLLPDRQGLSAPPGVRPIYDAGGLPHGFVFERPRRVVRFNDRAVLVERD